MLVIMQKEYALLRRLGKTEDVSAISDLTVIIDNLKMVKGARRSLTTCVIT
jgi:hypothetical protein